MMMSIVATLWLLRQPETLARKTAFVEYSRVRRLHSRAIKNPVGYRLYFAMDAIL